MEARKGLQSQETWRSHSGFSSHTTVTVEKLSWCPSLPEGQAGGGRAAGGLFGVGAQVPPVWLGPPYSPGSQTHLPLPGAGLAEWPQCVPHARDSFLLELLGLGSGQLSPRRADVAAHVMGACHACREGVSAAVLHFGSKQLSRLK